MKKFLVIITILLSFAAYGQDKPRNVKTKIFTIISDTIQIDTLSINPNYFKVYKNNNQLIDSTFYKVDYIKSQLFLENRLISSLRKIKVEYQPLPEFLTKTYAAFDKNIIVPKVTSDAKLYSYQDNDKNKYFKPFDGLHTSGSLSRGITMGNNQDAVVNSNFNLQIEGKLSKNVGVRASITDNEIPLQEGGYTQRLDEFDRVFIELFSKKWSLKAGDIDLINTDSYFMKFQKKISGISVKAKLDHNNSETNIFASAALVRGRFNSYKFNGIAGNQGPYKILGSNNELFVFLVSGSEKVYANGILLKRGENFDYIIDYNTGEITFTTIYTISSNMRFTIEYQIADNNYTRLLTFDGVEFNSDKLQVGLKYYNESDAKNKPIQQDLTNLQKQILADAGNDKTMMVAPSVIPVAYSENKVLYRKELQNNQDIYIYSNDSNDELYQVSFSFVGENNGDYFIKTTLASGRVYEFISEVNGIKQGAYAPVIQLIAPEKKQIITFNSKYSPSEKTNFNSEISFSNYDQNLYSNIDNDNNNGLATKVNWNQVFFDKKWKLKSNVDFEYIDKNFKTIERFRNVEFSRDWNIDNSFNQNNQKQQYILGNLSYINDSIGGVNYQYENLQLGNSYKGNRHSLQSDFIFKNTKIHTDGSVLNNKELVEENTFYRWYSTLIQNYSKTWFGAKFNYENNERREIATNNLTNMSHKYSEIEGFFGIGDSAKIFVELGYNYRTTDSLRILDLQNVRKVNTYFLKSKLIQNKNADLSMFINYQNVKNANSYDERVLNSRTMYGQKLFNNFITLQTLYETQSGNLPQQEFTYIEVESGKGFYEWIDFNENEIQELDEFVVAQFQDQAKYVRVLLPSISFIKTNKNRFSQSINLNANQWQKESRLKKVISHFNNHTYFLTDVKSRRDDGSFNLNPFAIDENKLLNLDLSFKNSLFFNRGLQKFSSGYTFIKSRKKSVFVFGDQDVELQSHQFQFLHKMAKFWLVDFVGGVSESISKSISYSNRNYKLKTVNIFPQISYLYSKNSRLEVFYKFKNKKNQVEDYETLQMHVFGANFQFSNKEKFSINTNINLYFNEFEGNTNSPVAFQMLEGLQPGTNFTWLLSLQKRLTSYLDININYFGRKSEGSKTIHTGTVQLRATF
ncbi:MAG: hypothetical protein L3J08_04460 [Flavobacteriaceae bacterium]|nr:hypothetical protein [Flavobacteriaceae bacterium]